MSNYELPKPSVLKYLIILGLQLVGIGGIFTEINAKELIPIFGVIAISRCYAKYDWNRKIHQNSKYVIGNFLFISTTIPMNEKVLQEIVKRNKNN